LHVDVSCKGGHRKAIGLLGILGGVEQQRGVSIGKLPIVLEKLVMGKIKDAHKRRKKLNLGGTHNKLTQITTIPS
jgi:hypothetical protein